MAIVRHHWAAEGGFKHYKNSGFSLLELLIALGLGVFMLAGIVQVTVGSKQAFEVIHAQAASQEAGRFGMSFVGRSTRSAGYINPGDITTMNGDDFAADLVNLLANDDYWAAQNGFTEGAIVVGADSAANTLTDADTSLDSFTFRTEGDANNTMLDCAGTALDDTAGNFTRMTYYVDTNDQLRCAVSSPAGDTSVVLVSGVEDMQVLYGVGDATTSNRVLRYLTASQMTATDWPFVVSIRVGMMTRSDNSPLDTTGSQYTVLDKTIDAANTGDGRARQVFTQTVSLRSQLSG